MSFFEMVKNAAEGATALGKKYAPAALSPEKRFAFGVVTACALITMADGDAEESEINEASDFLMNIEQINSYIGLEEANEIFAMQISELQKAHDQGSGMFAMAVNKMIGSIKSGVTDPEWTMSVMAVAEVMATKNSNGKAGPDEIAMLHKMRTAIG